MTKKTKIILLAVIAVLIAGMAFYPTIKRSFTGNDTDKEAPAGKL
jgi:hypothetical protein